MPHILFIFAVVIATTSSFVGLLTNLFIAVVNYRSWMRSHRMSSSDRILFSLAITRFLMLGLFLLNVIFFFSSPTLLRSVRVVIFFVLCWMFLDSTSLWFVTLLNTLYCVKITNFQHSVFLLLKRNLSSVVPGLLLVCVLISAFTTLLYSVLRLTSPFAPHVTRENGTRIDKNGDTWSLLISLVLRSFLQFIINVTSASLLINSLRKHIQKMQRSATGFWNPQTEAHVGAMKLMIYFLVLYIPYSVTTMLLYLPSSVGMSLKARSICVIISSLCHPGHSILIILTHPKLKTKAMKFLCFNR
ncbi:taste receptor type 2 member 4-like [Erinaceus europaeus]|uniref:Taste receptor type 2 n=1 Tax=Erinaceus europaeus TaxID=9365 RepID=A0A1S3AB46_ERIEU|nr:taste receptor type 2 member 4-like [Erinaceus europaeus]